MKPTKEQIQWFWEHCGFQRETDNRKGYHWEQGFRYHDWLTPSGETSYGSIHQKGLLPPIDLNNLFKYAVPMLPVQVQIGFYYYGEDENEVDKYYAYIGKGDELYKDAWDNDPALALFWAIYKAWGLPY